MRLLVNGAEAEASARAALGGVAEIVPARYGDIWLRDTGPIFARRRDGAVALRFKTNSWGGKFDLPDDATVGDDIARLAGLPVLSFDFVLEGGAVDHDGEGTILATRQTLLNPNRNGWSKAEAEAALEQGARRQEGHLDRRRAQERPHRRPYRQHRALRRTWPRGRASRRPAPTIPTPRPWTQSRATLEEATDAKGRKLEVIRIPGPGLYRNALGEIAPASHINFVIANGVVVMPVYGTPTQDAALEALQAVFPDRKVVGVPSRGLLGAGDAGGGSFHCITQQEPA